MQYLCHAYYHREERIEAESPEAAAEKYAKLCVVNSYTRPEKLTKVTVDGAPLGTALRAPSLKGARYLINA